MHNELFLTITKYNQGGGVERVSNHIHQHLQKNVEIDSKFICMSSDMKEWGTEERMILPIPPVPILDSILFNIFYFLILLLKVRRRKRVIIFVHAEEGIGAGLLRVLFPSKIKVIHVSHGLWPDVIEATTGSNLRGFLMRHVALPVLENMEYQSSRLADEVIAVSEETAEKLDERYGIAESVTTIYNPISNEFRELSQKDCTEMLDLPVNRPIQVFIGDDLERKGFNKYLMLLEENEIGDVFGVIVSRDAPKYFQDNSVRSDMRIYDDFVSKDTLNKIYSASTFLVFMSNYESFGLVPAESIYCGTLPIVSTETGISEVFNKHGKSTYVAKNSIEAKSAAMDISKMTRSEYSQQVQELQSIFKEESEKSLSEYERVLQKYIECEYNGDIR